MLELTFPAKITTPGVPEPQWTGGAPKMGPDRVADALVTVTVSDVNQALLAGMLGSAPTAPETPDTLAAKYSKDTLFQAFSIAMNKK